MLKKDLKCKFYFDSYQSKRKIEYFEINTWNFTAKVREMSRGILASLILIQPLNA